MTTTPLLEVTGLRLHYRVRRGLFGSEPVKALDGVDLWLERGETLAVVGESGSGKTTLGRAVLRLAPLTAGSVRFAGQEVDQLSGDALLAYRRRVQAVFQDAFASLSPYMRLADLVEEPLLVHGVQPAAKRREKVEAALELVKLRGVRDTQDSYTHTLSGGQRQRVGIARALVLDPELLVLDEPVSMIDASSRAEILYLLRDLQAEKGLSYLFITHDLASALHFADRIAVLYLGRVVEHGPVRTVIGQPHHPYTRGLLAAVPEPEPANRHRLRPVIAGEPPSAVNVPPGCPFHPRCPQAMPGICDVTMPPVTRLGDGHEVACHLYPEAGERPDSQILMPSAFQ